MKKIKGIKILDKKIYLNTPWTWLKCIIGIHTHEFHVQLYLKSIVDPDNNVHQLKNMLNLQEPDQLVTVELLPQKDKLNHPRYIYCPYCGHESAKTWNSYPFRQKAS